MRRAVVAALLALAACSHLTRTPKPDPIEQARPLLLAECENFGDSIRMMFGASVNALGGGQTPIPYPPLPDLEATEMKKELATIPAPERLERSCEAMRACVQQVGAGVAVANAHTIALSAAALHGNTDFDLKRIPPEGGPLALDLFGHDCACAANPRPVDPSIQLGQCQAIFSRVQLRPDPSLDTCQQLELCAAVQGSPQSTEPTQTFTRDVFETPASFGGGTLGAALVSACAQRWTCAR